MMTGTGILHIKVAISMSFCQTNHSAHPQPRSIHTLLNGSISDQALLNSVCMRRRAHATSILAAFPCTADTKRSVDISRSLSSITVLKSLSHSDVWLDMTATRIGGRPNVFLLLLSCSLYTTTSRGCIPSNKHAWAPRRLQSSTILT